MVFQPRIQINLLRFALVFLLVAAPSVLGTNALQAQTETTSPKPRAKAMQLVYGKVYYNGVPLTAGDAQFYAISKSASAAAAFRKAARIRGWNYFWWIYGGYNAGFGLVLLGSGDDYFYTQGVASVLVGGTLAGITIPREKRRQRLLAFGVSEYNKAVQEETWED